MLHDYQIIFLGLIEILMKIFEIPGGMNILDPNPY